MLKRQNRGPCCVKNRFNYNIIVQSFEILYNDPTENRSNIRATLTTPTTVDAIVNGKIAFILTYNLVQGDGILTKTGDNTFTISYNDIVVYNATLTDNNLLLLENVTEGDAPYIVNIFVRYVTYPDLPWNSGSNGEIILKSEVTVDAIVNGYLEFYNSSNKLTLEKINNSKFKILNQSSSYYTATLQERESNTYINLVSNNNDSLITKIICRPFVGGNYPLPPADEHGSELTPHDLLTP